MIKTQSKFWDYLSDVCINLKTNYSLGKFGQFNSENSCYEYDCVCLIKSFSWCNGKAGNKPVYKLNNQDDIWIGEFFKRAKIASSNFSDLEKYSKGIFLVYLNNEHIGVYNAENKTVIECCGGSTNRVVGRNLHYYDGSKFAWNKWSTCYFLDDEILVDSIKEDEFYRVQIGSFEFKNNAINFANKVTNETGFSTIVKYYKDVKYYRVQVGAFRKKEYAESCLKLFRQEFGYDDAFICNFSAGEDVEFVKGKN